jgi:hypothetical protein
MLARLEAGIGRFVLSELCDSVRDEKVVSQRHGEHRGAGRRKALDLRL